MHKAWSSIGEVPYCFSQSSIKFQGHTGQKKITNFDPNCVFPHCDSSLTSSMDMKWCKKLDVVWKCSIVFQGRPSNFTVTWAEKFTILIQFKITRPVAAIKSLRFALFPSERNDKVYSLTHHWHVAHRYYYSRHPLLCPAVCLSVCLSTHPFVDFKSLCLSDDIEWHTTGTKLVQVMACCLTAGIMLSLVCV